jgi:hypothetical protein
MFRVSALIGPLYPIVQVQRTNIHEYLLLKSVYRTRCLAKKNPPMG